METILYAVIAALWMLLNTVAGFMLKNALAKIGVLESKVSNCVTTDRCDSIQIENSREFKAIYKHNDEKFNQLLTAIKDGNDKLESKFDKVSDKLTDHLIEHHA